MEVVALFYIIIITIVISILALLCGIFTTCIIVSLIVILGNLWYYAFVLLDNTQSHTYNYDCPMSKKIEVDNFEKMNKHLGCGSDNDVTKMMAYRNARLKNSRDMFRANENLYKDWLKADKDPDEENWWDDTDNEIWD